MHLERVLRSVPTLRGVRACFGVVLTLLCVLRADLCPCDCPDDGEAFAAVSNGAHTLTGDPAGHDSGRNCPCDENQCPDLDATVPSRPLPATLTAASTPAFAALVACALPFAGPPGSRVPGLARDIGPPAGSPRFEILRL